LCPFNNNRERDEFFRRAVQARECPFADSIDSNECGGKSAGSVARVKDFGVMFGREMMMMMMMMCM
jgi:hypothetical protein